MHGLEQLYCLNNREENVMGIIGRGKAIAMSRFFDALVVAFEDGTLWKLNHICGDNIWTQIKLP